MHCTDARSTFSVPGSVLTTLGHRNNKSQSKAVLRNAVLQGETTHHIHRWLPCNFEKFKMSAAKEKIERQERSCQNES